MNKEDIDEVAGLVSPYQGQRLVYGEVEIMKNEPAHHVPDGRHEAPRRVVRPMDLRRLKISANH